MKFVFLLSAACVYAQNYRVAGVLLNSETAAPVARAHVSLIESARTRTVVTGSDGHFQFDVPEGKYSLVADFDGAEQRYGRPSASSDFGIAVVTGPGQETGNLVFRWFPPAAISGKVTDQFGDPVERAKVSLLRLAVVGGRKRVYFYSSRYTDDRGEYRFGPIVASSYYISVTGSPWYAAGSMPLIPSVLRANPELLNRAAYAPMYFPGTHDPRAAAATTLKPGEEGRADFTLDETRGVTLSVRCDCGEESKILLILSEGVNGFQDVERQASVAPQGSAVFGLTPGRYALRVTANQNGREMAAWQIIEAASSDLETDLTLKPAPSIVGTVEFKDSSKKPAGAITMRMSYDLTGFTFSRTVAADGSFEFAGLQTGKYQPIGVAGDFVSYIYGENGQLHDGYFDLAPGVSTKIRVVATDEGAGVKGFVKLGERPLPGVIVVLAPRRDSENIADYRGYQTDSDGSFEIQTVRPGEYYLFAVDAPDLEWTNPIALRPYFASAKTLRVEARGIYNETLPLSTLVRQAIP